MLLVFQGVSRCFKVFQGVWFSVGSLSTTHQLNAPAMLRLELGQFLQWHLQRCFAPVHTLDLDSANIIQESLKNNHGHPWICPVPSNMSSVTSHEESWAIVCSCLAIFSHCVFDVRPRIGAAAVLCTGLTLTMLFSFFFCNENYVRLGFSLLVILSLYYELNERNRHKSVSCETELSFRSEKECQASTQTLNFCQLFRGTHAHNFTACTPGRLVAIE